MIDDLRSVIIFLRKPEEKNAGMRKPDQVKRNILELPMRRSEKAMVKNARKNEDLGFKNKEERTIAEVRSS